MNARLAVVAGIVVLVIVAAVVGVLATRGSDTPVVSDPTPSVTASDAADQDAAPAETGEPAVAGQYETYSEEAVAAADGRILLFFHASWCPQCRAIEDDIRAQGVPAGVTILHVDYDTNQELRQRYGVTLQTTFVEVDADGAALQTHVAYDEPTLAAVVAAMLPAP